MGRAQHKDAIDRKLDAWAAAKLEVREIVEQHPLQKQVTGNILVHASSFSPADQHVDLIIRVADWLLENEEQ